MTGRRRGRRLLLMPTNSHTPAARLSQIRALNVGLATLPPTDVIKVGGKSLTVQQYMDQLKGDEANYVAVINAQKVYKAAQQNRAANEDACQARCSDLTAAIKVLLGPESPSLVDFGITPNKPRRASTLAEKTEAAAKGKATRVARHTMGPKQKAAIHGEVPEAGDGTATPEGTSTSQAASSSTAAVPSAGTGNG